MDWLEVLKCIEAGEGRTVEFKAGFDTSKIGPAACAFANSEGGVVILGVQDQGNIVGIAQDPDSVHERITQFLGNAFSVPMTASYGQHQDPRGWVHWIKVSRQRNLEPMQYRDVAWVRRERSSVRPSPSELQELNNRFGYIVTEDQVVSRARLEDLDEACFRDYLQRMGLTADTEHQPELVDDYENLDVIRDLDGRPTPTLFGLLAFGRDPQRFSQMRQLLVRNTAYAGSDRASGVVLAMDAGGRLHDQVHRTLDWARSFGKRETFLGTERTDQTVLPIDAIREAVTNAVIHRDYAITGTSVSVDVFCDRIEIASPGTLPNRMTLGKVRRGGNSRPRNHAMVHYAIVMGMMEKRGMGWPMIGRAMAQFNGTAPRIEEDRETAWVHVTLDLRSPDGDPDA